jgi:cytochrome c-type biogenesis protein CcmH
MADDPSPPAAAQPAVQASGGRGQWVMFAIATVALAGALGFALTRGDGTPAPQAAAASAEDGMSALEARSRAEPDNAGVWVQLAEARFDSGDFPGAVTAYTRASELSPGVAAVWSGLGEAMVMATPSNAPPMPAAAIAAFRRANGLDRNEPRARYFLAVKRDLDGDHSGAVNDWLALLADTPQGAPWETDLRRTIEQVAARNNIDVRQRLASVRQRSIRPEELPVAAQAIPGPSRQQMQDAASLPKGQQDMMVQGMVDSLEQRLRDNPQQPDRWIMLMRSRMTLGETQKAAQALRDAVRANPAEADRLNAQARMLGVPGA